MKFYFPFPFSDKIFCDIQHVMNRRNIIAESRTVRLIRTPAALIYHAVLCCIFAVSLSIIHETQIPFTFFRDFLKKVFGGDGKPHRHPFGMPPVRVAAPSVHIVQSTRVLLAAAPTTPPCFRHWRRSSLLPTRGGLGKEVRLCEMPRAPLLAGAVAAGDWGVRPTKKRPHHSKEQWGRFTILQWVPLIQPWGLREPLPPQPLRRALPERQERQRASEPASPRAWGDSDRPSAGRG